MPTLNELFEQARAQVDINDEAAKASAMEALKASWSSFYQALTNLGFGAAQAKFTKDLEAAREAQRVAEQKLADESTKHQQQIRELQDKAPDVATVNKQWEDKLEELRTKHRETVAELKGRVRSTLLQRDQASFESELVARGVPKAVAKRVARDPDLLPARADYDEAGSLSVRQAGLQIAFAPGSGQTHLGMLAEEIVEQPDIKEILLSNGDRGSGVSGGSRPGGGDADFYKGLRQQVKDGMNEGIPAKPLRERVQGR